MKQLPLKGMDDFIVPDPCQGTPCVTETIMTRCVITQCVSCGVVYKAEVDTVEIPE